LNVIFQWNLKNTNHQTYVYVTLCLCFYVKNSLEACSSILCRPVYPINVPPYFYVKWRR